MLPARIGAALALIAAVGLALSACGRRETAPAAETVDGGGVLSQEWLYTPASAETASATGLLVVEPGIDSAGPSRGLVAAKGIAAMTHLTGEIDPGLKVGERTLGEVMELRAGARPTLYTVAQDQGLCGPTPAQWIVWYEPELTEGRELVLGVVQGARPGETGSTVCRVLRYTRERERGAGKSEGSR
ncbi:MAG: hypothetical protein SGJ23_10755 [Alphaproteobacteria bacterium]|nr:hypothetical protein [Alphaproteobacteria bacterium]